jgi:3-oxoacyl-[acyl-carrier protein] reductase
MSAPATPRVAVVTGGSGGIGRMVSERLAADGMAVLVHYSGNQGRADEVVAAITAAGGTASAMAADVANEQQVAALFERAE